MKNKAHLKSAYPNFFNLWALPSPRAFDAVRCAAWESGMMRRVDVFVAGSQKCGTTTLHAYLRNHPDLSPPLVKEPHFFDNERRNWMPPFYDGLNQYYAANDHGRLRYDATPIHGFWPPSLARIRDYNPEARLIFLFRDPVARAWSHWCMEWARGAENLPFAEAIRRGRARLPVDAPLDPAWRVHSYVERGRYGAQMVRALTLFPRAQMLFLKSEDFARYPEVVLARISDFLGIAPFPTGPLRREHMRPDIDYPAWPTVDDRALVQSELAGDRALFARLSGMDISDWTGAIA